jgi:hypothetical protein
MKRGTLSHGPRAWCPSSRGGEGLYEEACAVVPQAGLCEGEALGSTRSNTVTLPKPKGGSQRGTQSRPKHCTRPLYSTTRAVSWASHARRHSVSSCPPCHACAHTRHTESVCFHWLRNRYGPASLIWISLRPLEAVYAPLSRWRSVSNPHVSTRIVKIFEPPFLLEVTPLTIARTSACLSSHSHRYSPSLWTVQTAGER